MLKTTRVLVRGGLWQYLAITLAFVAVTVGGVSMFGSDNLFGTYLVANTMLCIMFYLMTGISLGSVWPDLCLSMGATRRQYYAGLQLTMLLGFAGYLAIMAGAGAAWQQLVAAGRADEKIGFMLIQLTSRAELLQGVGILAVFGQLGLLLGLISRRAGWSISSAWSWPFFYASAFICWWRSARRLSSICRRSSGLRRWAASALPPRWARGWAARC